MASGIYHKKNVLKYRVLEILHTVYFDPEFPDWLSTRQLADALGIEPPAFGATLSRYRKYGLVRRSQRRSVVEGTHDNSYKWRITRKGTLAYFDFKNRLEKGFDLNRKNKIPQKATSHLGITKQGSIEFGITRALVNDVELSLFGIYPKDAKEYAELFPEEAKAAAEEFARRTKIVNEEVRERVTE